MEQLPVQMLVLGLEPELAFLDKLTQDLVLAVRYVCTLTIKKYGKLKKKKKKSLVLFLGFDLYESSFVLRCPRCKKSVVFCELQGTPSACVIELALQRHFF